MKITLDALEKIADALQVDVQVLLPRSAPLDRRAIAQNLRQIEHAIKGIADALEINI